jgi:putative transposase
MPLPSGTQLVAEAMGLGSPRMAGSTSSSRRVDWVWRAPKNLDHLISESDSPERGERILVKREKHTPEQMVKKLREAGMELAKGATGSDVSRKLGVSEQMYYRWKQMPMRYQRGPAKLYGHLSGQGPTSPPQILSHVRRPRTARAVFVPC